MANKDYYEILGISKSASPDEIKKAFHKMAHKYHPDKRGGDEVKFKEASEAYQVLSDDNKRRQYDNFGQASGEAPGWDFSNFAGADGAGVNFDFGDIFGDLFSGGGRPRERRGRDIAVDIQIPFAAAIFGVERLVLLTKVGTCATCSGKGAAVGSTLKTCATCSGKGQIRETRRSFLGTFTTARECTTCSGRGQVPDKPCPACHGRGVLRRTEEVKIVVPAGTENGEMIRLTGQGEATAHGVAGDLYVRVHVDKHPSFQREGHNLAMNLEIKLTDALLGAEYSIKTLEDTVKLKVPEGAAHGEILRIKGRGVPTGGGRRGDLLVKLAVKIPTKISKKARGLVEELKGEGV